MNVMPRYERTPRNHDFIPEADHDESALAALVDVVRRQLPLILFMILLGLAGAGLYLFTATPWYTASADVMMEAPRNVTLPQDSPVQESPVDPFSVESQVTTIKSERISRAVINDLNLAEDPEFVEPAGPMSEILARFRALLGSEPTLSEDVSDDDRGRTVAEAFGDRLSAERLGDTYVLRISFTARTPDKAARIANQVAEAYISDQLQSKFEANQRAEAWLKERANELNMQAQATEKAVLDFKLANNIMTADRPAGEQRISDLDQRLNEARTRMTEAESRLNRTTQAVEAGLVDAAISDALSNTAVTQLRQRYLDTVARADDWAKRYGEQHEAVVTLRNEAKLLQQSMLEEVKRIQQTNRSDYEIARSQLDAASNALKEEFERSGQTRQAQAKLRELESAAHESRTRYDNFVQRQMQTAQQLSIPTTEARVITNASPPAQSSHPRVPLVMALGLAAGLGAGLGIGSLRELLNRNVRTRRQLENASGVPCLCLLPKIKTGSIRRLKADRRGLGRELTPRRRELDFVLQAPFSHYAEGIRAIKLSADLNLAGGEGGIVIGVVSALPGEGNSTVTANLAFLMAQNGGRVLLIDCDMRDPDLTSGLAPQAGAGLRQVLTQASGLDPLVWEHAATGLHFLPAAAAKEAPANASTLLSSPAMEQTLGAARSRYDYIVLDFAPLLPVVDGRAAAHLVDGVVLVTEWGKTPLDAVSDAVSLSSSLQTRLLGSVLNKVDARRMRRYGEHDGRRYARYFEH